MTKEKSLTTWCIPVPRTLDDAVERAVAMDNHVSKSEIVRDAVRQFLARIKVDEQNERRK